MADKKMKKLKERKHSDMGMMIDDSLPTFSLTETQLPQVKTWKIKNKYKLEIEVQMTGTHVREYDRGKPVVGSFKIIGIKNDSDDDETKRAKKGYA